MQAYEVLTNPSVTAGMCIAPQSVLCWAQMARLYTDAVLGHSCRLPCARHDLGKDFRTCRPCRSRYLAVS